MSYRTVVLIAFTFMASDIPHTEARKWLHRLEANQRHHYYDSRLEILSFDQAETECRRVGGHLATISSEDEHTYILRRVTGAIWIGLNVTSRGHEWTSGEPLNYTNYVHSSHEEQSSEGFAFDR